MRQLKIAKMPSRAQQAEATAALQWLKQQPVSVDISKAEAKARWRYLVAVARQYPNCGLSMLELVGIGYRAGLVAPDLWTWRVRDGMAGAVIWNKS